MNFFRSIGDWLKDRALKLPASSNSLSDIMKLYGSQIDQAVKDGVSLAVEGIMKQALPLSGQITEIVVKEIKIALPSGMGDVAASMLRSQIDKEINAKLPDIILSAKASVTASLLAQLHK